MKVNKKKELEEKYNLLSSNFSLREYRNLNHYMEHRAELLLNWGKKVRDGDTILELGCGDGYVASSVLAKTNGRVNYIATDFSEGMLRETVSRCNSLKYSVQVKKLDINNYELLEDLPRVDCCVAFMRTFFNYARDPQKTLTILRRKIRKKIIVDFNPRKISETEVLKTMKICGFSNIEIRGFFVPLRLYLPFIFIKGLILLEGSFLRKLLTKRKFNCLVKGEI